MHKTKPDPGVNAPKLGNFSLRPDQTRRAWDNLKFAFGIEP